MNYICMTYLYEIEPLSQCSFCAFFGIQRLCRTSPKFSLDLSFVSEYECRHKKRLMSPHSDVFAGVQWLFLKLKSKASKTQSHQYKGRLSVSPNQQSLPKMKAYSSLLTVLRDTVLHPPEPSHLEGDVDTVQGHATLAYSQKWWLGCLQCSLTIMLWAGEQKKKN